MKTILLVDDEPVILEIYSEVLSNSYKTILAENGQEALDILKTTSVDLIISDIEMPILSGIELLQQRDKKIPIIIGRRVAGWKGFEIVFVAPNSLTSCSLLLFPDIIVNEILT